MFSLVSQNVLNILSLKLVNSSLKATLADFSLPILLICDCNLSIPCSKIFAIPLMYKNSSHYLSYYPVELMVLFFVIIGKIKYISTRSVYKVV